MDDVTALAADWCETVAQYGPGRDLQEPECLTAFLDTIGEGLRLRRQLDGLTAGQQTAALRRKIMRCLVGLQVRAIELTSGVSPDTRATAQSQPGSKTGSPRLRAPSAANWAAGALVRSSTRWSLRD